jgi:hypothetical protein
VFEEIRAFGGFDLLDSARPLREATDAAIQQAIADARMFASLGTIAQAAQALHGADIGGLGTIDALLDHENDATGIALLVRQAVLLRGAIPDGTMEELARSVASVLPIALGLLELQQAHPD